MKILVACEFSGVVRDAFRAKGHDAWSCDIEPCTGDDTYHLQQDVLEILYDDCWDMLIAHPPCTYLANSGVHLLHKQAGRWDKMVEAAIFFRAFLTSGIKHICVENPVMHKYAIEHIGRKYDQTIQPYQFGHPESKRTCLWLVNLPKLQPTNIVKHEIYACKCGCKFKADLGKYGCPNCCAESGPAKPIWDNQTPSGQNKLGPSKDRAKLRSVTYKGIAEAMAEQWGIE